MRLKSYKHEIFLVFVVIITSFAFGAYKLLGWPMLARKPVMEYKEQFEEMSDPNRQYVVEKFVQTQLSNKDIRSGAYLTHHKYLIDELIKMELKLFDRTFTLNDICYKPHSTIIKTPKSNETLYYLDRYGLEAARLSPCLIVTPLNCFYDMFKIHKISGRWTKGVDPLNRRMRHDYERAIDIININNYISANDGIQVLKGWAEKYWNLAEKHVSNEARNTWYESIMTWIASLKEPSSKMCADPLRSCADIDEATNHYNVCKAMDIFNNYEAKRGMVKQLSDKADENLQQLIFEFLNPMNEEHLRTTLGCKTHKDSFVEWVEQGETKKLLSVLSPDQDFVEPDYKETLTGSCPGMFQENDQMFSINRTMNSAFSSMMAEFVLMTPENFLFSQQEKVRINRANDEWTIEMAEEVIERWRIGARRLAEKYNKDRGRKLNMRTEAFEVLYDSHEGAAENARFWGTMFAFVMVTVFFIFAWAPYRVQTFFVFGLKTLTSFTAYMSAFNRDEKGNIVFKNDIKYVYYGFILIFFNIFNSTMLCMLKYRTTRRTDREKEEAYESLQSVHRSSVLEYSMNQALHLLEKYINNITLYETWKEQHRNDLPRGWPLVLPVLLAISMCYMCFGDSNIVEILVLLVPSYIIYFICHFLIRRGIEKGHAAIVKQRKRGSDLIRRHNEVERLETEGVRYGRDFCEYANVLKEHSEDFDDTRQHDLLRSPFQDHADYPSTELSMKPFEWAQRARISTTHLYLWILGRKRYWALILGALSLILAILSCSMLFFSFNTPDLPFRIPHDDINIDVITDNFYENYADTDDIVQELAKIDNIQLVSNWKSGNFKNSVNQFESWRRNHTILAEIIAPSRDTGKSPFSTRLRYEFINYSDKNVIYDTVQKMESLMSRSTSFNASGRVYSIYKRFLEARNRFIIEQLQSSLILLILAVIVVKVFDSKPTWKSSIAFAALLISAKLQLTGPVWMVIGVDSHFNQHHLITNISFFITFLLSWPQFSGLARYQYRKQQFREDRTAPETNEHQREYKPPFAQFSDTLLIWISSIVVLLISLVTSIFVASIFTKYISLVLCCMMVAAATTIIAAIVTTQLTDKNTRRDMTNLCNEVELNGKLHRLVTNHNKKREPSPVDFDQLDDSIVPTSPNTMYAANPAMNSDTESEANDEPAADDMIPMSNLNRVDVLVRNVEFNDSGFGDELRRLEDRPPPYVEKEDEEEALLAQQPSTSTATHEKPKKDEKKKVSKDSSINEYKTTLRYRAKVACGMAERIRLEGRENQECTKAEKAFVKCTAKGPKPEYVPYIRNTWCVDMGKWIDMVNDYNNSLPVPMRHPNADNYLDGMSYGEIAFLEQDPNKTQAKLTRKADAPEQVPAEARQPIREMSPPTTLYDNDLHYNWPESGEKLLKRRKDMVELEEMRRKEDEDYDRRRKELDEENGVNIGASCAPPPLKRRQDDDEDGDGDVML